MEKVKLEAEKTRGVVCPRCMIPILLAVAGIRGVTEDKEYIVITDRKVQCRSCKEEFWRPLFFDSMEEAERRASMLQKELASSGFRDSSLRLKVAPKRAYRHPPFPPKQ